MNNHHPLRHFDGTECVWPPACANQHQRPKHRRGMAVARGVSGLVAPLPYTARHRLAVPVDSRSLTNTPARHLRTV